MKLYYSPGACSLASHIALHEAGATFDLVKVDLKVKRTETGQDYAQLNPKGYVPALELEDGVLLTENVAVLTWIAKRCGPGVPAGDLGEFRLLETLAFISTEIHKGFKPFFTPNADDDQKAAAADTLGKRFGYLAERMQGDYLFGDPGVADDYLFVMLFWAGRNGLSIPRVLSAFEARMRERPAVQEALGHEGLL